MDCSLPGSSVHGILQARILEWFAMPFFSPGDLPHPGIQPGSPGLQADSLLSEPPGKPQRACVPRETLCLWSQPEAQAPDGGFGYSWCLRQPVSPQKRPRPPETACSLRERRGSWCQLALPTLETVCARPRRPWGGSPSWRLPQSTICCSLLRSPPRQSSQETPPTSRGSPPASWEIFHLSSSDWTLQPPLLSLPDTPTALTFPQSGSFTPSPARELSHTSHSPR